MPEQYAATDTRTGLEVVVTGDFPEDPDDRVRIARTTTLFTRLIEGPFPKYEDVIPKGNDKKVVLNREAFLDALRRVALLSDNLTHQVRVAVKPARTPSPAASLSRT